MNTPNKPHPSILVVDDLADSASSLAELLKSWGFDAHAVYSGRDAVKVAHHVHPDLVIMDIRMPIMNGVEAARQIRREEADHPPKFVAMSAYLGELNENEVVLNEFDFQMVKPGNLEALREIIETACHKRY